MAHCDKHTLEALQNQLALATDDGDWEAFLACFVPGASASYGQLGTGAVDRIVEKIKQSQARYDGTMNLVCTHQAVVEGDRAKTRTYVVSHHFRKEDGLSYDDQAGTHYSDELVRISEGWKIERRIATLRWFRSDPTDGGWL